MLEAEIPVIAPGPMLEAEIPVVAPGPMLEAEIPELEDDNVAKGLTLKQQLEKKRLEKQEIESARQMEYLRKNPIKIKTGNNITNYTQLQKLKPQLGVYGGNKNTKKNKKYLKNKLTRGKARKYKNRTRKHRSIKHRINKKLNKRSKRKI
jgi:hypothetical protein